MATGPRCDLTVEVLGLRLDGRPAHWRPGEQVKREVDTGEAGRVRVGTSAVQVTRSNVYALTKLVHYSGEVPHTALDRPSSETFSHSLKRLLCEEGLCVHVCVCVCVCV